jgi:hypothetical protein
VSVAAPAPPPLSHSSGSDAHTEGSAVHRPPPSAHPVLTCKLPDVHMSSGRERERREREKREE